MSKTIQIGNTVILKKSIKKVYLEPSDKYSKDEITNTFYGLKHKVVVSSDHQACVLEYATRAEAVTAMKHICNQLDWKYHETN